MNVLIAKVRPFARVTFAKQSGHHMPFSHSVYINVKTRDNLIDKTRDFIPVKTRDYMIEKTRDFITIKTRDFIPVKTRDYMTVQNT